VSEIAPPRSSSGFTPGGPCHNRPVSRRPYTRMIPLKTERVVSLPLAVCLALLCACMSVALSQNRRPDDVAEQPDAHQRAGGGPTGAEYQNTLQMRLVRVEPGTFVMGGGDYKRHEVIISRRFYIGMFEVTQSHYEAVMEQQPSLNRQSVNPVERVTWYDALEFCRRLGDREGLHYRLPSEAEWEYACRAGSNTDYFFGNSPYALESYCWYGANSGRRPAPFGEIGLWILNGWEGRSHPIGRKKPNPWGLRDIYGNVWEWCSDWFGQDHYERSPVRDPRGPRMGEQRVVRGGSWSSGPAACSSWARGSASPFVPSAGIGFRVVLEAER